MKVSIITATYNSEATIGVCANSVLKQTYPDIEYLIIDGGSTDQTLTNIKKVSNNYAYVKLHSEPDKGIYDALNKGISKSSGEIIGFVHSDDFLASDTIIAEIVEAFKTYKVHGVYGNLHYVGLQNTQKIIRNWISQPYAKKLLKKGWMPAHPTLYLKKALYDTHGNFNLKYKISADYDFVLRIFKRDDLKFHYLPKTIVKMRVGGASNRNLRNIVQKTREDYSAVRENKIGNWYTIFLKNLSKIVQFRTKTS